MKKSFVRFEPSINLSTDRHLNLHIKEPPVSETLKHFHQLQSCLTGSCVIHLIKQF